MDYEIYYKGHLKTECVHTATKSVVETDAPRDNGGSGHHFSPTDLFAVSLGSCILTIMGIAAKKRGLKLDGASAEVSKKMHPSPRKIKSIRVLVRLPKEVPEEERKALEEAGRSCPVSLSLHPEIEQAVSFIWE